MRRVSVILCSYNSLNYLKDTLLNIYEQDYKNIEVIVKDGGSNDGTQELLEKFEKKFEHDKKRLIWKLINTDDICHCDQKMNYV